MITIEELKQKTDGIFYKTVSRMFRGDAVFPLPIPGNKRFEGLNLSDWKAAIQPLVEQSKEMKEQGYSIGWRQQRIGGVLQKVPARIYFESLDDYLFFVKRRKEYDRIVESRALLVAAFPSLKEWADANTALLSEYYESMTGITCVLQYFAANPINAHYYLRELPIEVHSKFIEQHSGVLKKLLDLILPTDAVDFTASDFVSRYRLKKPGVYTQIRILDDSLRETLGYDECALTLEDAAFLNWVPKRVFLIENQSCFLSFPKVEDSVAIFGEGFKSRLTHHFNWLDRTELYCWFDLDAAGFEMLNMIRARYPNALSFLMNKEVLKRFSTFIVNVKWRGKTLPNLTGTEEAVYQYCVREGKRLEQERITHGYVVEMLRLL